MVSKRNRPAKPALNPPPSPGGGPGSLPVVRRRNSALDLPSSALKIRPAKVARAKRLLQDPSYPPPEVIRSVARLLSKKLK